MPDRSVHTLLPRLRRAVGPDPGGVPDAQLVQRFVAARDGAAFETLVWRHGPMVLAACRRLLRHEQDAEDAFQATFLALARKAGTIGRREAVAGWLHRVARRVARRAARHLRTARSRRPALDEPALLAVAAPPEPDPAWADLRRVLDEEIGWLPRKYREAFVLCCLEGLTDAEAARQLGCPPGTVVSRLSRARQRLRQRLAGRALVLTAGTLVAALEVVAATPASAACLRRAVLIGGSSLAGAGSEKELLTLWDDLASDQGIKAYTALRMLRADPLRSVPFLQERLKPRDSGVDDKKVSQLIADLDSDDFATREKAAFDLEKLGKTAEPMLRQALSAEPSLEATRRLERLLGSLGGPKALTPEQWRDVRAVRVLEQVGTPASKKLLEALAKESLRWWVTQEAKAALGRLAPRDKKP